MNNWISIFPSTCVPLARRVPLVAAALAFIASSTGFAQDRIFRCAGNEYTNNATTAAQRGCKVVEGGNVTVVTAPRRTSASASSGDQKVATASQAGSTVTATPSRIDAPEQRARDSDAREILESELKKVEAKQAELLKEFNNGAPEKRGDEMRNNQRYLDRIADLKAQIARNDSDIAGIRREIARAQPATASR